MYWRLNVKYGRGTSFRVANYSAPDSPLERSGCKNVDLDGCLSKREHDIFRRVPSCAGVPNAKRGSLLADSFPVSIFCGNGQFAVRPIDRQKDQVYPRSRNGDSSAQKQNLR